MLFDERVTSKVSFLAGTLFGLLTWNAHFSAGITFLKIVLWFIRTLAVGVGAGLLSGYLARLYCILTQGIHSVRMNDYLQYREMAQREIDKEEKKANPDKAKIEQLKKAKDELFKKAMDEMTFGVKGWDFK